MQRRCTILGFQEAFYHCLVQEFFLQKPTLCNGGLSAPIFASNALRYAMSTHILWKTQST